VHLRPAEANSAADFTDLPAPYPVNPIRALTLATARRAALVPGRWSRDRHFEDEIGPSQMRVLAEAANVQLPPCVSPPTPARQSLRSVVKTPRDTWPRAILSCVSQDLTALVGGVC
jgi:hypothetical protein